MKTIFYRQCTIHHRNNSKIGTVAWLPETDLEIGTVITLVSSEHDWVVEFIGEDRIPDHVAKAHAHMHTKYHENTDI